MKIEVVRGQPDAATQAQLLEFWRRRAGFGGEPAQRRLPEVVCVARVEGQVIGSSSVAPAELEFVGGRRFLIFRCLLDDGHEDGYRDLLRTTFEAIDREPAEARGGAEGMCAFVEPDQSLRHPEAVWDEIPMVYAGYLSDRRQVRIAYFTDQVDVHKLPRPEEGWDPGPGYEIFPFAGQTRVSAQDAVMTWVNAGALTREQAEARVAELLLVATGPDGRAVGLCTGYLAQNERLRAEFWHYRLFVLREHRHSGLGISMVMAVCGLFERRYLNGEDRRGVGILTVVENEALKSFARKGRWRDYMQSDDSDARRPHPWEFFFIGEDAAGGHVRIHYFPGAQAPGPPEAARGIA